MATMIRLTWSCPEFQEHNGPQSVPLAQLPICWQVGCSWCEVEVVSGPARIEWEQWSGERPPQRFSVVAR